MPVVFAASTVRSGGQVMLGGSASKTVTVKEQFAVLRPQSVAVQVTVVVPLGKAEPEGGLHATLKPLQLSEAFGSNDATAEQRPGSVVTAILLGQVTTGGRVSATVNFAGVLVAEPALLLTTT